MILITDIGFKLPRRIVIKFFIKEKTSKCVFIPDFKIEPGVRFAFGSTVFLNHMADRSHIGPPALERFLGEGIRCSVCEKRFRPMDGYFNFTIVSLPAGISRGKGADSRQRPVFPSTAVTNGKPIL